MTSSLKHKTFVTSQIPQSGRGPLPDGSTRMWSPITSTLIMGRDDAVLVDPPLTEAQAAEVGADIGTLPFKVLEMMYEHPLTKSGLEKFLADYRKAKDSKERSDKH